MLGSLVNLGGRLAQRESVPFTRGRPLVQSQYRPPPNARTSRPYKARRPRRCPQRRLIQFAQNMGPFVKPLLSLSYQDREQPMSTMMSPFRAVPDNQISAILADLADVALVGMTIVLDSQFLYANKKCCELFGYSK